MSPLKIHRTVLATAVTGLIFCTPPGTALADNTVSTAAADPLTWNGITLYGTVDAGIAYLNHGAPLSDTYGTGLPFLIQKFSNRPITSVASNGLSQSKIGISGLESLTDDLSVIFKLETGFLPTSGRLGDGPASLVRNNGKPLAEQTTAGDTSRAGQAFQGAAYMGLGLRTYGTLTVGRQNSLMADDLARYDPQQQSQAFSPIGYSGTSGGLGDTEDKVLDNTVKYNGAWGLVRVALLHQFGQGGSIPATASQADVGVDYHGLSVDVLRGEVNDAVSAASLSATQAAALPPGTLAGTISDNSGWSALASYDLKPVKIYVGWERIRYADPDHPVAAGAETIGGYVLSIVNNTAYANNKIFTIDWLGARWAVTPKLELTGAFYHYHQNSYAEVRCADASSSACNGNEYDVSAVTDYHFNKRFDAYLGVNGSTVQAGLSSDYLYKSAWGPMLGGRFSL